MLPVQPGKSRLHHFNA